MKQKTFELDDRLAADFEQFCRSRMLIEKRVAAVALRTFMRLSPEEREQAMIAFDDGGPGETGKGKTLRCAVPTPAVGLARL